MTPVDQQVSSLARDRVSVAAWSKPALAVSEPHAAVSEPSCLGVTTKAGTTTPTCDAERFFAERFADTNRVPLADVDTNGASSQASTETTGATAPVDAATRLRALLERAAADARAMDAHIEILRRERDAGATDATEGTERLIARLVDAEATLTTYAKAQSEIERDRARLRACVASHKTRVRQLEERQAVERAATAATAAALDDARDELASTRARLNEAMAETMREGAGTVSVISTRALAETPETLAQTETHTKITLANNRKSGAEAAEAAAELASSRALYEAAREELQALHAAFRETSEACEASAARILELESANARLAAREKDAAEAAQEAQKRAGDSEDVAALRASLDSVRAELVAAEEEHTLAVSWARNAAKEEAEEAWAGKKRALEKALVEARAEIAESARLEKRDADANAIQTQSIEASDDEEGMHALQTRLILAVADAKAHAAAAAAAVADVNLLRATLTEERALAAATASALAEAEARLRAAAATESSLIARVRDVETRSREELAEVSARVAAAEATAAKNLSASAARAEAADASNARLARELWLTRQKAETDARALEMKLEDARKRASELAVRHSRNAAMRRPGGVSENAAARDADAVLEEMRRELEAETAASEAAAAESARREGISRRKLAGAEEKLKQASTALADAAKKLDARDAALRRNEEERCRVLEAVERAERRAQRAEDALAARG